MHQTEPENQVIPWYQPERCIDSDLGSHVLLLSAVVLHQIPDKIPPFIAGIDQNDRCRCHGAALVDRYFISQRTFSQKGEGTGPSTEIILTGHHCFDIKPMAIITVLSFLEISVRLKSLPFNTLARTEFVHSGINPQNYEPV